MSGEPPAQDGPEEERQLRDMLARFPRHHAAHRALGTVYKARGDWSAAAGCFRRAIELLPTYIEAWNNLGNTLIEQQEFTAAAECFRRAVELRPEFAGGYLNLGQALARCGQFEKAVDACRRATEIEPANAEHWNALGTVLFDRRQIDEAERAYERALAINAEFASARYNRALARLIRGDYQRGWADYESRLGLSSAPIRNWTQPRWDGRELAGTLLLDGEQGLGDTIQFARFAARVKSLVGRTILRVPGPLVDLLAGIAGADEVVANHAAIPSFDAWIPLMSVPYVLGVGVDDLPGRSSYIEPRADLVEYWRRKMAPLGGLRIGLHWQGNPDFPKDRFRSIPLRDFEPLAQIAGATIISLQRGAGVEQLAGCSFPIVDLRLTLNGTHGSFPDSAAILKCLDLLITSDSSLVHLAGALGVPTWLCVPFVPEWRWLLDRDDSPWYPSMRLFRQLSVGDWASVVDRLGGELARLR